jgi:hypothetical protein
MPEVHPGSGLDSGKRALASLRRRSARSSSAKAIFVVSIVAAI